VRVLLLKPASQAITVPAPPLGLGYLARSLEKAGIDVEILDMDNRKASWKDLDSSLRRSVPDLIGIQVHSRELEAAQTLIAGLRKAIGQALPIAIGGPHPSTLPLESMEHLPEIDYAIAGEGEEALPLLARYVNKEPGVERKAIPGLVWRENGVVKRNPSRFVTDLDALGFPTWEKMRLKGYRTEVLGGGFYRKSPAMTVLTSRGCPYHCTFCAAKFLSGRRLRLRSPELVIEEMVRLRHQWGFREIKIVDDNFTANREHVLRLAEEFVRRKLDVTTALVCGVHAHHLEDDVLDALCRMGVYELMIAIESASPRVLQSMRKPLDLARLPETVARVRRRGLGVVGLFILGYPGETREEMEETVRLTLRLPFDFVHLNSFSPFPGSEIYEDLTSRGLLKLNFRHVHFETINYSFVEGMSVAQLQRFRRSALMRFYLRPRAMLRLARGLRHAGTVKFLAGRALEYFGFVS
jgi:anaerobic magnesium-protoporphyrin IX monomethyl ester cyclase